jgi:hypothetical protein
MGNKRKRDYTNIKTNTKNKNIINKYDKKNTNVKKRGENKEINLSLKNLKNKEYNNITQINYINSSIFKTNDKNILSNKNQLFDNTKKKFCNNSVDTNDSNRILNKNNQIKENLNINNDDINKE